MNFGDFGLVLLDKMHTQHLIRPKILTWHLNMVLNEIKLLYSQLNFLEGFNHKWCPTFGKEGRSVAVNLKNEIFIKLQKGDLKYQFSD